MHPAISICPFSLPFLLIYTGPCTPCATLHLLVVLAISEEPPTLPLRSVFCHPLSLLLVSALYKCPCADSKCFPHCAFPVFLKKSSAPYFLSKAIFPSPGRWVSVTARMDKRQHFISLASCLSCQGPKGLYVPSPKSLHFLSTEQPVRYGTLLLLL